MNITEMRGQIIESFIGVEGVINLIITQHYFKEAKFDFMINVLADEQVTFGFKRNILKHILKLKDGDKFIEKLNRLNFIRNVFAHAVGITQEPPWVATKTLFQHPKKKNEMKDTQDLYDEYRNIHPGVYSELFKKYESLGGKTEIDPDQFNKKE